MVGTLTPSFILATKSLGFPCPAPAFVEVTGTDFGFAAENSESRKRYAAANTTPNARMMTSEDEATAMVPKTQKYQPEGKRRENGTDEGNGGWRKDNGERTE